MRWKKPKPPAQAAIDPWQAVLDAGNRFVEDIKVIEAATILEEDDKQALKHDATEILFAAFQNYIKRP